MIIISCYYFVGENKQKIKVGYHEKLNDNAQLYNNPNELSRRLSDYAGLRRQEVAHVDASARFAVYKKRSE
jgi:hypothetical protein